MPETAVWAIILLPLIAAGVNGLLVRPFLGAKTRLASLLTIAAIGGSFLLSLRVLSLVWADQTIPLPLHEVAVVGNLSLRIGLLADGLTAVMLVVVTGVSFLIQIYSHGYMRDDPSYARYFTYMALFTSAMLTLVLANNLILLYAGWELVGLSSYLLIGFWFQRPAAAAAAKKAFIVTRIGDLFFLLAIIGIFFMWPEGQPVTFVLSDPEAGIDLLRAPGAVLSGVGLTLIALGIFAGAAGKSAQFPLHVWLPDAMEGPTPVSALIHAATMVVAGVFLVARFLPFFVGDGSETARMTVALIGAFTVIFAASMGLVASDIKRVLAYSTISQLGYMFMALGLGFIGPALFHLFNHAFFKALLFLGAGSVNHATGTFDMREMGGLRRVMPWTYGAFLIGSLSLAGIPPFSGFWSKDEILGAAWTEGSILGLAVFGAGILGVFLTATYIFRALYMTFHGRYRGGEASSEGQSGVTSHGGLHESPLVMVVPMALLALLAVGSWVINFPGTHYLTTLLTPLGARVEMFQRVPALISLMAGFLGIAVATALYWSGATRAVTINRLFGPVANLLSRKYYMDDLYEDVIIRHIFYRRIARFLAWFDSDKGVVDRFANGIGFFGRNVGRGIARFQTGQLQTYATALSFGVVLIFAAYLVWGR